VQKGFPDPGEGFGVNVSLIDHPTGAIRRVGGDVDGPEQTAVSAPPPQFPAVLAQVHHLVMVEIGYPTGTVTGVC
jgi:hypothetical protein